MKLISNLSTRETIIQALTKCRQQTLAFLTDLDKDIFVNQSHPNFSPIGWHLGHIAFTEAYWILEYLAGYLPLFPEYHKLFAADGLPKNERKNLPEISVIQDYLATVRNKVLTYLETAPIEKQERVWWWLIQHECQHNETINIVWQIHQLNSNSFSKTKLKTERSIITPDMVEIEAGEFFMGSNHIKAQDNERPEHKIYLDKYYIDRYPVTYQQYQQFISADGYKKSQYWSKEGWQWLQKNPVSQALYGSNSSIYNNHPVCGINYYEAEAYANFVGKKLPTETQWEKAAQFEPKVVQKWYKKYLDTLESKNNKLFSTSAVNVDAETQSIWGCYSMLGNVWEWTDSWFLGYQEFEYYLYPGYSQIYFDREHKVLKGGSWATLPWALRSSFRNWYHPWVRQVFAGFRCVMY